MVLDGLFIELAGVDTKPKTAILFRCKQHWCSIGGYQWSNIAMLEHVLNLLLRLLELEWVELIDWLVNGWSIILHFDLELLSHSH